MVQMLCELAPDMLAESERRQEQAGRCGSIDRCAEKVDTRTGSLVTASDLICTIQQKTSAN